MPIKKTEDGEQQAVMEWAALMINRIKRHAKS